MRSLLLQKQVTLKLYDVLCIVHLYSVKLGFFRCLVGREARRLNGLGFMLMSTLAPNRTSFFPFNTLSFYVRICFTNGVYCLKTLVQREGSMIQWEEQSSGVSHVLFSLWFW